MHIGILGSYFNPPHLGHLLVAQQVLDFTQTEHVWLMPGFKSAFGKDLLPAKHRLNMINMLQLTGTSVSTLEIDHQLSGNTIELIPLLKEQYPKDTFTFIIGSDQLTIFHKWGQWELLLQELPFLVVERAGYPLQPIYQNMKVLRHPLFVKTNISSTLIRERIRRKLSISRLVLPDVEAYIRAHQLYL